MPHGPLAPGLALALARTLIVVTFLHFDYDILCPLRDTLWKEGGQGCAGVHFGVRLRLFARPATPHACRRDATLLLPSLVPACNEEHLWSQWRGRGKG